jgi:hypothetical protein
VPVEPNQRVEQLAGLWKEAEMESFAQIPELCDEIARLAADGQFAQVDSDLLGRVKLLAARAERRLAECVAIQTRTGIYSTHGGFDVARRVATSGWEG